MKNGGVIWLCGLAGSGKSTLARALTRLLRQEFFQSVIYLDGDELREILGHFDYDKNGRIKMALKRAKLAKFLSEQGVIVVVSTISLFNEIYKFNRENIKNYFEIYVKCDFEELKRRDQKALYTKALKGEIANVVGVDIKFDEPSPNLVVENSEKSGINEKAKMILEGFLGEFSKFFV